MNDTKTQPQKQQGQRNQEMNDPKRMGQNPAEPQRNEQNQKAQKDQHNGQRERQSTR